MSCGGHGVGTPSPFRPSLSPGGVAPAPRRPASAHALPTFATVVASGGRVGAGEPVRSFVTGVGQPLRGFIAGVMPPVRSSITGVVSALLADSLHALRHQARGAWAQGTEGVPSITERLAR